jgi:hypothetical protein
MERLYLNRFQSHLVSSPYFISYQLKEDFTALKLLFLLPLAMSNVLVIIL